MKRLSGTFAKPAVVWRRVAGGPGAEGRFAPCTGRTFRTWRNEILQIAVFKVGTGPKPLRQLDMTRRPDRSRQVFFCGKHSEQHTDAAAALTDHGRFFSAVAPGIRRCQPGDKEET